MPCTHETFESAVVVTTRQGMNPEGAGGPTAFTYYLVSLQTRCTACQGLLTFELPPYTPQLVQVVSQAQGGTEARFVGHLAPLADAAGEVAWTATPTHRPAPPPVPEPPPPA